MEQKAIDILSSHRIMALATLRPDGWPQATMVGYVNDGLRIYFVISRHGQKFANIGLDQRVSVAIGGRGASPQSIRGLSLAGQASEVDAMQREGLYTSLIERDPAFAALPRPDFQNSALMRIAPRVVSIVDFAEELGHTDVLSVGADDLTTMRPATPADWGLGPKRSQEPS
jgi:nitroimidazol reductase NimA-like FMN-containing flavoprotein (pyridoxamine 5'-phosphate oxidase superfamily)